MRFYLSLFVILFIFSCNQEDKVPKNIIEKKKMQELVWDMARADAFLTAFAGKADSTFDRNKETIRLYKEVLQIHKVTQEDFRKSRDWYQKHPAVMKAIMDTLQERRRTIMEERSRPTTIPNIDSLKS